LQAALALSLWSVVWGGGGPLHSGAYAAPPCRPGRAMLHSCCGVFAGDSRAGHLALLPISRLGGGVLGSPLRDRWRRRCRTSCRARVRRALLRKRAHRGDHLCGDRPAATAQRLPLRHFARPGAGSTKAGSVATPLRATGTELLPGVDRGITASKSESTAVGRLARRAGAFAEAFNARRHITAGIAGRNSRRWTGSVRHPTQSRRAGVTTRGRPSRHQGTLVHSGVLFTGLELR
jgi:hypothetical protein